MSEEKEPEIKEFDEDPRAVFTVKANLQLAIESLEKILQGFKEMLKYTQEKGKVPLDSWSRFVLVHVSEENVATLVYLLFNGLDPEAQEALKIVFREGGVDLEPEVNDSLLV